MKKMVTKVMKGSAAVAKAMTLLNLGTMCSLVYHQPKVPQAVLDLRKR